MTITDIIRKRRSIYPVQYTGEFVDDQIILEALENANHAPNHGKTEPWRFVIFKGEGLKKLAAFQADLYQEKTEASLFRQEKYDKFFQKAELTSHVIAIIHHRKEPNKIPLIEEHEAIGCAVQNIYLSLTGQGVGGYWSSGGGVYTQELDRYLNLDNESTCLGLFFVGIPKEEPKPLKRGDLKEKIRWVV